MKYKINIHIEKDNIDFCFVYFFEIKFYDFIYFNVLNFKFDGFFQKFSIKLKLYNKLYYSKSL